MSAEYTPCVGNGQAHESEIISPEITADFYIEGKPHYYEDKLRCKHCKIPWILIAPGSRPFVLPESMIGTRWTKLAESRDWNRKAGNHLPPAKSGADEDYCEACGQSLGYRSAVSKGTVRILETVAAAIEEKGINMVHIRKELVEAGKMTVTQHHNLTHLTRLGLLANVDGEAGNYVLTSKAMRFLKGEPIPREVVVMKATKDKASHTVERGEDTCTIRDFMGQGEEWVVPGFEIKEGRIIRTLEGGQLSL